MDTVKLLEFTKLIEKKTKIKPIVKIRKKYAVLELVNYPIRFTNTFLSYGLSDEPFTMWRGLPCGFEVILVVDNSLETEDYFRDISSIIRANQKKTNRRKVVENNGIYAPGYAPHYFFCEAFFQTPKLKGKFKLGDGFFEFISAIPINDLELRMYDKNPLELIQKLRKKNIANWKERN
jgi:hypothetical protein